MRRLIENLRPPFNDDGRISISEFENHIKKLCEKHPIPYSKVFLGPISLLKFNLRMALNSFIKFDILEGLLMLAFISISVPAAQCTTHNHNRIKNLSIIFSSYKSIALPIILSFVTYFLILNAHCVELLHFLLFVLLQHFIASPLNIIFLPIQRLFLGHELLHFYQFFVWQELRLSSVIHNTLSEFKDSLGADAGILITVPTRNISLRNIQKIENNIIKSQ